ILEFVHENACELLLQMAPHRLVAPNELSRPRQQIGEVECAGGGLQLAVLRGGAGQFLLQGGGKISIRILSELLQIGKKRVPRAENFTPCDVTKFLVRLKPDTTTVTAFRRSVRF